MFVKFKTLWWKVRRRLWWRRYDTAFVEQPTEAMRRRYIEAYLKHPRPD